MGQLDDKVIAITGASRGLGEAMAIGYAAEGARLVLGARTVSDLERVAALCDQAGATAVAIAACDVTRQDEVDRFVGLAVDRFDRLDVFVANAATSPANASPGRRFTDLTSYDLATWNAVIDTNITGVWRCMKAAFPVMQRGGSFIVIGSGTGRRPQGFNTVYGTSKAGDDALTMVAAGEMGPLGVRVNCLSPGGMTDTNLFGPDKMPEALKARGFLTVDVIVPAAVWLASDASADVNGGFISGKEFNQWGPDEQRQKIAAGHMPS